MFDIIDRQRKAATMTSIIEDHVGRPLQDITLLNVGGSTGIIDDILSEHFKYVINIDIDKSAIEHAKSTFRRNNLTFQVGDACNLPYKDDAFDVIICSHVYEHVPFPERMMDEIFRCLAPGGICYFAASNRFRWNEPHYNLPLLSAIPRALAHRYIKLAGKADHYHELHYSYWGLRRLVSKFTAHDYTNRVIREPVKFGVDYMIAPGTFKSVIAELISSKLIWLSPGYIWLLEKPLHIP